MKGKAPNCSLTGFQSLPAKNLKPNACQERRDPATNSYTIRNSTPRTARPHTVMPDLKMRSGISPPGAFNRGDAGCAGTDVTVVPSTGCGPGISGRGKAGWAIHVKPSRALYKGVKIGKAFPLG